MFFLNVIFVLWFRLVSAASTISRSNPYSLNSRSYTLGPKTDLVISNKVISPDGFARSATLAGGTFPGPIIAARKGEHFDINVVNRLTDNEMLLSTSVHWHGIRQNGTNYADGVSFVTQCPIAQNHSFLHSFEARNQAGTFWYHSHYSVQQCDGLRGGFIIYDPEDPLSYLYDVDDETTVITLADWYHTVAPVLSHIIGTNAFSILINGLGRYSGGPLSDLAVVSIEYGKRYRLRLIAMSCDPTFTFSIDNHNLTVIEADGELTQPLLVDSLPILAGQRYSVVLVANQPVNNYWIRALPNTPGLNNFNNNQNSAILRYNGAPVAEPTTNQTTSTNPLSESNLHAFINPGAPGIPEYGKADINLQLVVGLNTGVYSVNGTPYIPPTVPVLLQILSGARHATDLLPTGSVYVLGANKVVELTMPAVSAAGPHPIHLHGHSFDVVQSAGSSSFNYVNPVRRDVVSNGVPGQQMVIRWVTDNSGPWFLHCHIDWHLDAGFAVVMAESPWDTQRHLGYIPHAWDELCPIYDSLTPAQIGAQNSYQEAQNMSTRLFPPVI